MSNTSAQPMLFVSYSRVQFYFAESVTLSLQTAGLDVWFDVQRLTPGSDWQAGIAEGLARCTSLLLIASRASLASPYVRLEWETALAAGKPVCIVLFEAVDLPPELSTAQAIIDMRRGYDEGIRRLLVCLNSSDCQRDRVPRPNLLRFPFVLPREIVLIAGALLLYTVLLLAWGLLTAASVWEKFASWTLALVLLIPCGVLLWLLLRFLYRRAGYNMLRAALIGAICWPVILILPLAFLSFQVIGSIELMVTGMFFGLGLFLPAPLVLRVLNARPPGLVRWLPTGSSVGDLRGRRRTASVTGALAKHAPSAVSSVLYRLHYQSVDEPLAAKVREAMSRFSHTEAPDAHAHLLLITRNTAPEWVSALTVELPSLTPIIADNIILSQYGSIARFQVVDFRRRDHGVLVSLARYYASTRQESRGRDFSLKVTPISFSRDVSPSVGSRLEDLQQTAPGLFTERTFNTAALLLVVVLAAYTLARDFSTPPLPALALPPPAPTASVSEIIITQGSVGANAASSVFGSTSITVNNLRVTLAGRWLEADITRSLPEPYAGLLTSHPGHPVLCAGQHSSGIGASGEQIYLLVQLFTGTNAGDYAGDLAGSSKLEALPTGDSQVLAQAVRVSASEQYGDQIGSVWLIVVENSTQQYLFHAFVTGPQMMLSAVPPALSALIASLVLV